jgi:hypothetical protein
MTAFTINNAEAVKRLRGPSPSARLGMTNKTTRAPQNYFIPGKSGPGS